jgi:hypothetical protein
MTYDRHLLLEAEVIQLLYLQCLCFAWHCIRRQTIQCINQCNVSFKLSVAYDFFTFFFINLARFSNIAWKCFITNVNQSGRRTEGTCRHVHISLNVKHDSQYAEFNDTIAQQIFVNSFFLKFMKIRHTV